MQKSAGTPIEITSPGNLVRFLRRPEVCALTGLKTSTLYEMIARGDFVRPVRLGKRLVAWPENEIAAWQAARLAEREQKD